MLGSVSSNDPYVLRSNCYRDAHNLIAPRKGAISVVGQLFLIIVFEFWVGVGIGWICDKAQRSTDMDLLNKTKLTPLERTRLMFQVTGVMVALTLCFIGTQRILRYLYFMSHCRFNKIRVVFGNQNTTLLMGTAPSGDHDVHRMHNGFAMFYGISGTTLAKLDAAVN